MDSIESNEMYAINENGSFVGKKIDLRHRKFRSEEPIYVKSYLEDLQQILSVNRGDIAVLIELMKYMNYDNIVDITPRIKDKIIEVMRYGTYQTVSNSISRLKRSYIILSVRRGSYLIDPKLFAKGKWSDIYKIKMLITYHTDGKKTINTDFIKNIPTSEMPVIKE